MFNNIWMNYALQHGGTPASMNRVPSSPEEAKVVSQMFKTMSDWNKSSSKVVLQRAIKHYGETSDLLQNINDNQRALEVQRMKSYTDIEEAAIRARTEYTKSLMKLDVDTAAVPFGPHEEAVALGKRAQAQSNNPAQGLYEAVRSFTTQVNADPVLRETHRNALPHSMNLMIKQFMGADADLMNVDLEDMAVKYRGFPEIDDLIDRIKQARDTLNATDLHKKNLRSRIQEMDGVAIEAAQARESGEELTPEKANAYKQQMSALNQQATQLIAQVFTGDPSTSPQQMAKQQQDMLEQSQFYTALNDKLMAYMDRMGGQSPANNPAANLVSDPNFRAWAADNGFKRLGSAVVDEEGIPQNYVQGADDAAAFSLFYFQQQHPERYQKLFGRGGASHTQDARQRVEITLPATPETLAKFDVSGGTGNPRFAYIKDVENGSLRYLTPDELLSETMDLSGPELRAAHGDGYMVLYDATGTRLEGEGEGPKAAIVTTAGTVLPLTDAKQIAEIASTAEPVVLNDNGRAASPVSLDAIKAAYAKSGKAGMVLQSDEGFDALKAQLPVKAPERVQYTAKPPRQVPIYGYIQKRHAGWTFDVDPAKSRVVLADGTTMDVDNDNMFVIDEPTPTLREAVHARQAKKTAESARETMAQRRAREEQAVIEGDPADAPLARGELPPKLPELTDPLQELGGAARKDKRLMGLQGKRAKAQQRNIDLLGEAVDKLSDDATRQATRVDAQYDRGKASAVDMRDAKFQAYMAREQGAAAKQRLQGVDPMPAAQIGDIRPMAGTKPPAKPLPSFGLIGAMTPVQGDVVGDDLNNIKKAPPAGTTAAAYGQLQDKSAIVNAMRPPAKRRPKQQPNPAASAGGGAKEME